MKINDLSLWEAYVAVAKQGNFAKAAQVLRTPVPQISKRVAKLESLLEVRLFTRSTRVVKLTDEGRGLLDRAVSLLEDSEGLETSFAEKHLIAGNLRITCAPFIAHRLLAPVLREYLAHYPRVEVQVDLSETVHDLIESNYDVALRMDEPTDTNAIYRKLFTNDIVFSASPEYLRTHPHPIRTPKDLVHHSILMLDILEDLRFKKRDYGLADLPLIRKIRSDDGMFIADLARQGMGVLVRAIWDVREDLEQKRLIQILPNYPLEPFGSAYAVIPSRKYLAPRVRAFMDLIQERARTWLP